MSEFTREFLRRKYWLENQWDYPYFADTFLQSQMARLVQDAHHLIGWCA